MIYLFEVIQHFTGTWLSIANRTWANQLFAIVVVSCSLHKATTGIEWSVYLWSRAREHHVSRSIKCSCEPTISGSVDRGVSGVVSDIKPPFNPDALSLNPSAHRFGDRGASPCGRRGRGIMNKLNGLLSGLKMISKPSTCACFLLFSS